MKGTTCFGASNVGAFVVVVVVDIANVSTSRVAKAKWNNLTLEKKFVRFFGFHVSFVRSILAKTFHNVYID